MRTLLEQGIFNEDIKDENKAIVILSGEGEQGNFEKYTGSRTIRAIKQRLTKERCNGDRWASVYIYNYTNDLGDVYQDMETGEQRHIDEDNII
jgi:hypothetical protein